jgi:nucleoside-diphosphate-sugar epimerase
VAGDEDTLCAPVSPYGVTKLAAEHLVRAYDAQFGVPATVLRFFSVYGPRQRPDMGYYKFVEGLLSGRPVTVFGDGEQRRGNTYVADAAWAVLLAAERFRRGAVYNVGGGEEVSANEALALLEGLTGRRAEVLRGPERLGEQRRTLADTTRAREELGWAPATPLRDGLAAQVAWQRELYGAPVGVD